MKKKISLLSVCISLMLPLNSHAMKVKLTRPTVKAHISKIKVLQNSATAVSNPAASASVLKTVALYEGLNTAQSTILNSSEDVKKMFAVFETLLASKNEAGKSGLTRDEAVKLISDTAYALMISKNPANKKLDNLANLIQIHVSEGPDSALIDDDGKKLDKNLLKKLGAFMTKYSSEMDANVTHDQALANAHAQTETNSSGQQVPMFSGTLSQLLELCNIQLNQVVRR